jgi:hypothetical protein
LGGEDFSRSTWICKKKHILQETEKSAWPIAIHPFPGFEVMELRRTNSDLAGRREVLSPEVRAASLL